MTSALHTMEEGRPHFEPTHRSCLSGRIVEIFNCCGICTTLPAAVGSGVMAYISNRWEYQVAFVGVSAATSVWCLCQTAAVVQNELNRPYVQSGKDVCEMRNQVEELQDIQEEKREAQGVLSKMLDKTLRRSARDREEAKKILAGMSDTALQFVRVRKAIAEDGKRLVTDQYLQEVKREVDAVLGGKEATEGTYEKLQEKVDILSALFKTEKSALKKLGESREEEVALLRKNRKLLKQFTALRGKEQGERETYLKKLSKSLEDYRTIEVEQAKTTENLRETAERFSEGLERGEVLLAELGIAADIEEERTAIAESAAKLRLAIANPSATAKELNAAIQAHLSALNKIIPDE